MNPLLPTKHARPGLFSLRRLHTADLHWYMRCLEEVAIRTLASFGLRGAAAAAAPPPQAQPPKPTTQNPRPRRDPGSRPPLQASGCPA